MPVLVIGMYIIMIQLHTEIANTDIWLNTKRTLHQWYCVLEFAVVSH